jgi:hypothetical protein
MTLVLPGANPYVNISIEEVASIMRQRRAQDSIIIRQMIETRDRYNGDVVLPVPDVDKSPTLDIPTPRLIAMAIDSTAMRAASSKPNIHCPNLKSTKKSTKEADVRRKMLYAKWSESQMDIKAYRWYRQMAAYGTAALVVMPDNKTRKATIELRDPLTSYPELRDPSDIRNPKNVGFIYGRSRDWIIEHFPDSNDFFYNAANRDWDTLWDIVEWIDEWEVVIGVMGPRMPAYSPQDARPYGYGGYELSRFPNKAGKVPVVMPRRVTLDRVMGQMATMIDTVDLHARMTALEVLAAERHVFPDIVMMSSDNQQARLVSGNWADGRTGQVNIVDGAKGVQYLQAQIPQFIPGVIEGLEDAIRQSGGASPLSGGDGSGMRTGRAIDELGSFSIDPRVEEMQRVAEKAWACSLADCIDVEKAYYSSAKHISFTGLQGDDSVIEYSPGEIDGNYNVVTYPLPGADISQMSVAVAQLNGAGLISAHTARVIHPMIGDAMQEEKLINIEKVESAVLAGFGQQVSAGQVPLPDSVAVLGFLRGGANIEDAINQAQSAAQARQAQQAPPPQDGQNTAPGQQPGLASPGMGAEQGPPPTIQPPQAGLQNYHAIATALKQAPPPQALNGPANA